MSFGKDIKNFIKKTENKGTILLRNICEEMVTRIADRTGVDTGNLLGNYRIGVNSVGIRPGFPPGPTTWHKGEKDELMAERNRKEAFRFFMQNLEKHLANLKLYDTFYMDTDVPYADKVEYIGWDKTPAYRMFGRTIIEFEQIVKQEVNNLKNV